MPFTFPIKGLDKEPGLWEKFKDLVRVESVRLKRTISLNRAVIILIQQAVKRGRINGK